MAGCAGIAASSLIGVSFVGLPAANAATPTVSMKWTSARVDQNTKLELAVTSAHLGKHTTLYLQRQFGTKHVWRNVEKLTVRNGTNTAPGVPIGRYRYRVVAKRGTTTIAASRNANLYSYGSLSLYQLCERSAHTYFEGSCDTGTIQVGSSVFSYAYEADDGNTGPDQYATVEAQKSSCRSLSLRYAVSNFDQTENDVSSMGLELTQASATAKQATSNTGIIASANFEISSSAWDLIDWTNNGYGDVYLNGTASCYTSSGDR